MGVLMDLIAGDAREILLAISVDDWAGLRDRSRFVAYISLGGGLDLTWLDLLALAARETTGGESPGPFTLATHSLKSGPGDVTERTVERVDPHWIDAVARLPESRVDRIAARWIELLHCEGCEIDPEEKPMLRELTGDLIDFCRRAEGAEDVLFAWSL
ncbi:MAG TPA: hypothetical protein VF349_08940 [Candidatus Limnocylindrales bacterium]